MVSNLGRNIEKGLKEKTQQAVQQGLQQGLQQGELDKAKKIAVKMLKKGLAIEDIIDMTELTEKEVIDIKRQLNDNN